jgi:ABC-type nitrate/sulfonate/bicarbonate transport system substrate-binding protein
MGAASLACAFAPLRAQAQAAPLTIGLLRNPVSALVAITEQKGWFRKAGVNYGSVLFAGAAGPKVIQAMGSGSIALGSVSVTAAMLAIAQGVPLKILSVSTDPAPAFALVSAGEIGSMQQLAGRKVATTAGTGLHYFLARALSKSGMTFKDIEFVNLPVADAQAAFLARRVDAVVPSLNGRYFIRSARKDARELFTHESFALPPGPAVRFDNYDVFVAPQAVVDSRTEALRGFLSAYHGEAVPYLNQAATRAAAITEITRYVNIEQKAPVDEASMRAQLDASRFLNLAEMRTLLASDTYQAGLEDQVRFFTELRQVPAGFSMAQATARGLI